MQWYKKPPCTTWLIKPRQESLNTHQYSRSFNKITYSCPCGMCSTNNQAFCQKSLFLQWIVCGKFLHAIWLSIFTFHSWHEFVSLPLLHICFWVLKNDKQQIWIQTVEPLLSHLFISHVQVREMKKSNGYWFNVLLIGLELLLTPWKRMIDYDI